MTVVHETREGLVARRERLLAQVSMPYEELCRRAVEYTLCPHERDVYEALDSIAFLLGEERRPRCCLRHYEESLP